MSIVEVAKLAGCSTATVSRVLNRRAGVSDEAAARVQDAAKQLNYRLPANRPGPQPKAERVVRTGHVAFLMFGTDANSLAAPTAASVVNAVENTLASQAYSMTLSQVRDETRLPPMVQRGEVDGLILHGLPPSDRLARKLRGLPAVWVMSPRDTSGYWGDRVAPDNKAVGATAAEYLITRGHSRIALLGANAGHRGFAQRSSAFERAAAAAGVTCHIVQSDRPAGYRVGDFRSERQYIDLLIQRFAQLPRSTTGLFVPRAQTTSMVFEALRAQGLEPGRDVTIVACDNDPTLPGLNPQIATIDVRPDLVGRSAVDQLMRRIDHPEPFSRSLVLIEPALLEPGDPRLCTA